MEVLEAMSERSCGAAKARQMCAEAKAKQLHEEFVKKERARWHKEIERFFDRAFGEPAERRQRSEEKEEETPLPPKPKPPPPCATCGNDTTGACNFCGEPQCEDHLTHCSTCGAHTCPGCACGCHREAQAQPDTSPADYLRCKKQGSCSRALSRGKLRTGRCWRGRRWAGWRGRGSSLTACTSMYVAK